MDYTMEVEPLRKWIQALRSGNYFQTTGKLRRIKDEIFCQYCAVGVGLDAAGAHWTGCDVEDFDISSSIDSYPEKIEPEFDPNEHIDYQLEPFYQAGFEEFPIPHGLIQHVIQLNDAAGLSFNQIADWLENNVKGVQNV